jgi:serine/threonine protein kinase
MQLLVHFCKKVKTENFLGMQYLASQGIIHRDLALRNLLVSSSAEHGAKYIVKVADFG